MKVFNLSNINTYVNSYQQFIDFYHETKGYIFENIDVELNHWFAANMSAVLGGLLDKVSIANTIRITSNPQRIATILQKNGFLANYGYSTIIDTNHTTVPYLKLKPTESRYFYDYVNNRLLSNTALPAMSSHLKQKITESIYEIFVNAQMHSETDYIYTCGQFFPKKHKIEFTIVDMGVGFKQKISKRFNRELNSLQAIRWAIEDGNSTKIGIPGGIGLAILKDFIKKNKGQFQIVSDDGFYQFSDTGEEKHFLNNSFPGSIINIQFRTDDIHTYTLTSEINLSTIF